MRPIARGRFVAALGTVALVWLAGGPPAAGDERPRASSQVQAPAQGGGGVEPVSGAPPAVAPSLEAKPAAATIQAGPRLARRASGRSMRRLAVEEGEATLDVDGVREVLRPGTRLGVDTVRSVSPERIVLEREAKPGEPGGPALVILTFDGAGRGTERVFWTADPGAPRPAEAKRP